MAMPGSKTPRDDAIRVVRIVTTNAAFLLRPSLNSSGALCFGSVRFLIGLFALGLMSCGTTTPARPGERFWNALLPICGQAFEGRLVEGTEPSDAAIGAQRLVMHVRSCSADEIRIPFHVGADRSRTWVITRTDSGVRLKHDHRHEDGTPDRVTQYGGDTREAAEAASFDFFADAETASLIPAAASNVWTLSLQRGTFSYALRRESSSRRFRVEFDLATPVQAPPPPW